MKALRKPIANLAAWLALFTAVPALAEPSPEPAAAADREAEPRWYGWQTLTADMAAAAVVAAGVAEDEPALFWPGMGAFVLTTPALHLAHDNGGAMWTSLGLRIGAPVLLGLVGGGLSRTRGRAPGSRTVLVHAGPGLLLGALLAIVVDAKILAYEEPPAEQARRVRTVALVDRGTVGLLVVGGL